MPELTAAMPPPSTGQGRRARQLRRAFQRLLKRRPTTIERVTMDRGARFPARAEAAAADPSGTQEGGVRVDGAATRAQRRMVALFEAKRSPAAPGLEQLLGQAERSS